jgi:hypothetical protein
MVDFSKYGPILVGGIMILAIGFLNPQVLQQKIGDRYSGFPSYIWLALISVCAGLFIQSLNPDFCIA